MPSLKNLKDRIGSVKSTKKITSAMKMVAASKLRKAQEQAEASQPYATAMAEMLNRIAKNIIVNDNSPRLLVGTGREEVVCLLIVTSDRGLCGGFNSNLVRKVREEIRTLSGQGKQIRLICAGRKGYDLLKHEFGSRILHKFTNIGSQSKIAFSEVDKITQSILEQFEEGSFDVCKLVYNEFQSVIKQKPSVHKLIPFDLESGSGVVSNTEQKDEKTDKVNTGPYSPYTFEPDEEEILSKLLPRNLGIQVYRAILDSAAGEQAARMTAMDNATRNAGDMIKSLTLQYNRERQAYITKELIEIISGAEAL